MLGEYFFGLSFVYPIVVFYSSFVIYSAAGGTGAIA